MSRRAPIGRADVSHRDVTSPSDADAASGQLMRLISRLSSVMRLATPARATSNTFCFRSTKLTRREIDDLRLVIFGLN
jgi:hypothetical protein